MTEQWSGRVQVFRYKPDQEAAKEYEKVAAEAKKAQEQREKATAAEARPAEEKKDQALKQ